MTSDLLTRRAALFGAAALLTPLPNILVAAPNPSSDKAKLLKLDGNENPYGPSPAARQAILASVSEAPRYADVTIETLTDQLAAHEGVAMSQIVIGAGSGELLKMAGLLAVATPGAEVVASRPTYEELPVFAQTLGLKVRWVAPDKEHRHDLAAMRAAITPLTRLVYVCNPNNPTSTVVDGAELAAFCKRFAQRTLVLVDEAYAEYVADLASMDALVRDGVPIVVARTFSKLFGLAGLRVGYAIAPPPIAERLRSARGVADRAWVAAPAARAAIASLSDADYVARTRREVGEVRTRFVGALEHLGLVVPAPRANFVYFEHARIDALVAGMAARGIRIGSLAQPRACRITIGLPSEMTAAAEALAAVLPTLR